MTDQQQATARHDAAVGLLQTYHDLNRRFGFCLKELRQRAQLSLRQLGKLVETDHAYLHRLEHGVKTNPSEELVKRLHRCLR